MFSHFISCGTYEAIHILDSILNNKSDIKPDTIHGDTHAQSEVVFGLSYLLGIKLMPRIRRWKHLNFYRSHKNNHYEHIDEIFTDVVNWELIRKYLPDMLRVALSIKEGRITASAILRKLGAYSRRNKLYQAFRELGRVIRTGFLLQYLSDKELRETIHAATCKSESFNAFKNWVGFGGEGVIRQNSRDEQRKVIKYNHLVANCICLYNVASITKVLNDLSEEGISVNKEALKAISPYITSHINRFGNYQLDLNQKIPDMQYQMNN